MEWYTVFLIGLVAGMIALSLTGAAGTVVIRMPDLYWTLDRVKHGLSLFIATGMMLTMLWYFS